MKVLLITNEFDYPISDFIKYLILNKIEFIRDNGNNIYQEDYLYIQINSNNNYIEYYNDCSIYIRKSGITKLNISNMSVDVSSYFNSEIKQLKEDIFAMMNRSIKARILGRNNFGIKDISKINVLYNARKIGLTVPDTIITTSTKSIVEFLGKHSKAISKSISNAEFVRDLKENITFNMYTEVITKDDIKLLKSQYIFPSIIQVYIEKLFEIRVFILDKKYFGIAIFSQASQMTKADFRNHDFNSPNKIVPYKLPRIIKEKLKKLMRIYDMNNASVDFIYSTDGNIYFLEINPFGQFGFYTKSCNYFIEKEITNYLIKEG